MENSVVRQFKNFGKSNNFNFGQSGCIQTLHQQSNLGKSRIQNLPSHRRQNLSSKLDLVVVFQTIQIQRLSVEIQTLRVKLKDSQRQITNYLSYQIQIKQLTQSCMRLEYQNESYQAQVQKLNLVCQKMYSQLQQMHEQYDQISLDLPLKFNNLKLQNSKLVEQIEKLQILNSNLEEKTIALCNKYKEKQQQWKKSSIIFSQQITRLNETILSNTNYNKEINLKNDALKAQIQNLKQQNHKKDQKINKQSQIIEQLNHLKRIAQTKIIQVSQFKGKLAKIIQDYHFHTHQNNNILQSLEKFNSSQNIKQKLNKQIDLLYLQLQETNKNYKKILAQLQDASQQSRQSQTKLKATSQILLKLSKDFDRNSIELNDKSAKLQKMDEEVQQYKNLAIQLKDELEKNNMQNINQFKIVKQQVQKYKQMLKETDDKLILILKKLEEKQFQINNLKGNLNSYQVIIANNAKLQQKCSLILNQLQVNYVQLDRQKNNNYNMQKNVSEIQSQIQMKDYEICQLNNRLKTIQLDLMRISKQKMILQQEIVNKVHTLKICQAKLKQQENQNKNLVQILQKRQSQLEKSRQQLKEAQQSKSNHDMLLNELTNLKNQSQQKQRQISILQNKIINIEHLISKITQIQKYKQKQLKQFASKIKKVNQVFAVNEIFIQKILYFQSQIGILQNQNMRLSGENKLMNFQLVQTHKINTMSKRRDSVKTNSSLKSQNQSSIVNSQNQGERQIFQSLIVRN